MIDRKDLGMSSRLTKSILALSIVLGVASLTACNTVEGAGKDISKAGDKIEETAKDVKRSN